MKSGFNLVEASAFDARKGYTRWIFPGVDMHSIGSPRVSADLWTDREGRLMVRFTCVRARLRYVDHFQIVSASGAVADDEREAVEEWLGHKMVVWMVEDFEAECVWDS